MVRKPKRRRILLPTLLLALGMAGTGLWCRARIETAYWRWQLPFLSEDRIPIAINGLQQQADHGLRALVDALASPRSAVASAAESGLRATIQSAGTLSPANRTHRLAVLAEALADRAAKFHPLARVVAAELVAAILRQPLDGLQSDRSATLAACDRVLEATARERQLVSLPAVSTTPDDQTGDTSSASESLRDKAAVSTPSAGKSSSSDAKSAQAGPEAPLPGQYDRLLSEGEMPVRKLPPVTKTALAPIGPPVGNVSTPIVATPQPAVAAQAPAPARSCRDLTNEDLMRRLGKDPHADAVRAELTRRGITEVQMELARQLFHPDPEVRKRLCQRLPEITSVDALPWLLQLADDPDPEVRRMAASLLATTGDPQTFSNVRRRMQGDPDPRIQDQFERLSERPMSRR